MFKWRGCESNKNRRENKKPVFVCQQQPVVVLKITWKMLKKKYFELNASLIFHAATSIFLFVSALPLWSFLDGSTHLYMRVCPSVGRSVRRSVHPSVRNPLFSTARNGKFSQWKHWGRPTLTLLKVLNVLKVLKVLNVLNVLNMPIGPIAQRPIAQGPIDTRNNQS